MFLIASSRISERCETRNWPSWSHSPPIGRQRRLFCVASIRLKRHSRVARPLPPPTPARCKHFGDPVNANSSPRGYPRGIGTRRAFQNATLSCTRHLWQRIGYSSMSSDETSFVVNFDRHRCLEDPQLRQERVIFDSVSTRADSLSAISRPPGLPRDPLCK